MAGPEGDRLIRVDMTTQTVSLDPFPEEWKLFGGRGLSAKILTAECDPKCDPLGPGNVLVMAPGVLSGTSAPTSGRISIGGKSPLTGGIKEANAGGNPAQHLMKLGFRAVIVKGQPADPEKRYGLKISAKSVEIVEADDYKGLWNYACCEKLLADASGSASAITIGPAGEMRLKGASVACTDQEKDRHPARHAARGGLGAVMGSKGLKWVLIDPGKARMRMPADSKAMNARNKEWTKEYKAGPMHVSKGTGAVITIANMLNTLPYKNRTSGQCPDADTLDGANILKAFETRGGRMHGCHRGCTVQCSPIVNDAEGNYKTSGFEFETLTLLGANCAVASWEDVADLDRLCDEIGIDTIETGAALAVLMDSGGMEWGDVEAMKKLLREIPEETELGKMIGNGAVETGKKRGHKRVPHAKGQAIPAWDPRTLKATGVAYASGPMGADHTAGLIVNPAMPPEELARASQEIQLVNAVNDSSGFCCFFSATLDDVRRYYTMLYGEEVTREQIADQGWEILQDEWRFNEQAGLTAADDVLSDCMVEEGIGPADAKFDVDAETIAAVKVRFPIRDELFLIKATG